MTAAEKATQNLVETVGLKEFFTSIIDISDKRFEDRYNALEKLINKNSQESKEAVKSALDAQERAVNVAMAASEKAVLKAEIAAEKRFDNFAENYTKALDNISKQVGELREAKSGVSGEATGRKETGITLTNIILILIAAGALIANFFKG